MARPLLLWGLRAARLKCSLFRRKNGEKVLEKLLRYGIERYGVERLAVNEQNPQAKGFYAHMGFQVYKRTDRDEQGNPYPLLYMRLGHDRHRK